MVGHHDGEAHGDHDEIKLFLCHGFFRDGFSYSAVGDERNGYEEGEWKRHEEEARCKRLNDEGGRGWFYRTWKLEMGIFWLEKSISPPHQKYLFFT